MVKNSQFQPWEPIARLHPVYLIHCWFTVLMYLTLGPHTGLCPKQIEAGMRGTLYLGSKPTRRRGSQSEKLLMENVSVLTYIYGSDKKSAGSTTFYLDHNSCVTVYFRISQSLISEKIDTCTMLVKRNATLIN